jgi:nucleotide-binding universal stress UspA family protein
MATVAGHLIVGYDGSDAAREAVRKACAICEPGVAVTVSHAYEIPFHVEVHPWFADFKDACREVSELVVPSPGDGS